MGTNNGSDQGQNWNDGLAVLFGMLCAGFAFVAFALARSFIEHGTAQNDAVEELGTVVLFALVSLGFALVMVYFHRLAERQRQRSHQQVRRPDCAQLR